MWSFLLAAQTISSATSSAVKGSNPWYTFLAASSSPLNRVMEKAYRNGEGTSESKSGARAGIDRIRMTGYVQVSTIPGWISVTLIGVLYNSFIRATVNPLKACFYAPDELSSARELCSTLLPKRGWMGAGGRGTHGRTVNRTARVSFSTGNRTELNDVSRLVLFKVYRVEPQDNGQSSPGRKEAERRDQGDWRFSLSAPTPPS